MWSRYQHYSRQICSEGAAVCRSHTAAIAVLKDCSPWRRGPPLGQGKCEEGETTERSCCGLTMNPYFPLPLHHSQGEKDEEPGTKLSLGKGRGGDSSVAICLCFSLSRFFFLLAIN